MADQKEKKAPAMGLLVSIKTAAMLLAVSKDTLYRKLRSGELVAVRCGSRTLLRRDTIEDYVAALPRADFATLPAVGAQQHGEA